LDEKGAALTGALGALSSGFELIGAEKAAEALNQAGLATDFLSGVGQAAALAVEAQAGATKVLTVAQKAANIAMRANPIGLVVTAVLALTAGLVLAYNKSETFRNIVQDAGRKGKAAMDLVVGGVSAVVSWVRDRVPAAFSWLEDKAGAAVKPVTNALGSARDGAEAVWDWVGKIPGKLGELKDKAAEIADPLLAPFRALQDALEWIDNKLDNLKVPDWVPGFGSRTSTTSYTTPGNTPAMVDSPLDPANFRPQVNIRVDGALDPNAVAAQIRDLLKRYDLAVS
jgi:hypothetical protein